MTSKSITPPFSGSIMEISTMREGESVHSGQCVALFFPACLLVSSIAIAEMRAHKSVVIDLGTLSSPVKSQELPAIVVHQVT